MAPIDIRGNNFDPTNPGEVDVPPDASKTDHVLVQMSEEMSPTAMAALKAKGASIVKRMNEDTWLLNYPPTDLNQLQSLDEVEHALVYLDDFVIHADLKSNSSSDESRAALTQILSSQEDMPAHLRESIKHVLDQKDAAEIPPVAVVLHEDAVHKYGQVVDKIRAIKDITQPEVLLATDGLLYLKVKNSRDLDKIAAIDEVQAIEKAPQISSHNDRIRVITSVNGVNLALSAGKQAKLSGTGQSAAVVDSGVDPTHDAFKAADKIMGQFSTRGDTTGEDMEGHGTHVAATIAGLPMKDWKNDEVSGLAPAAQVASWAVLPAKSSLAPMTPKIFDDIQAKFPRGCRVINNSWGTSDLEILGNGGPYPYRAVDAELVDQWAYQNPEYLIVVVTTYATAKNVLTVGASYTDRPTSQKAFEADKVDYADDNLKVFKSKVGSIPDFSSWGPVTGTNRTKPDIVAPGVGILSARANTAAAQELLSEYPKKFGSYPGGPKADDKLIFSSGTSMAAPATSGCAILLREALSSWQKVSNPSAPLLKALLINGADILPNIPTGQQGFGQLNMSRALQHLQNPVLGNAATTGAAGFKQGQFENLAQSDSFQATVPKPSAASKKVNFVVTLVYHDFPGAPMQNKMNLRITYQGHGQKTKNTIVNENVLRLSRENVVAGQQIQIEIQPVFILPTRVIPWGLAWSHYETA